MSSKRSVWQRRVSAWERSGLTRSAFCAPRRINVHSFDYWRRKLRHPAAGCSGARNQHAASPALVPVQVIAATTQPSLAEVTLPSGLRVRLPLDADLGQLRNWLGLLQSC